MRMNIEQYVENRNHLRKCFNLDPYSLSSPCDRQRIADDLMADLSPENVSCDGEVRGQALVTKVANLNRCVKDLIKLDSTVRFDTY